MHISVANVINIPIVVVHVCQVLKRRLVKSLNYFNFVTLELVIEFRLDDLERWKNINLMNY